MSLLHNVIKLMVKKQRLFKLFLKKILSLNIETS